MTPAVNVQSRLGGGGAGTRILAGGSSRELLAADWQLLRMPFLWYYLRKEKEVW